ncbi:MAG: D-amino-acid transaminase, partial [Motiliproteus sp.]|nr:D-amino-acid transaminase [Motiliproteus sp.]
MSRTVYVNGEFVAEEQAKISIFDRGFLFADGVYEVTSVLNGKLIDNDAHLVRLHRSLDELDMPAPLSDQEITQVQQKLLELNQIDEGMVYLQITRGAADRDFGFPENPQPSLVLFTQKKTLRESPKAETGLKVILTPDLRWARRDIKTVGLLAPCMAKSQAVRQGADDAWFVEDGYITEGSSNNAFIVKKEGDETVIVTRQLGCEILHGITRRSVMGFAKSAGFKVEERPFSAEEAKQADEAFLTSATTFVLPVVQIDDTPVGDGKPGPVARQLREFYIKEAMALT